VYTAFMVLYTYIDIKIYLSITNFSLFFLFYSERTYLATCFSSYTTSII